MVLSGTRKRSKRAWTESPSVISTASSGTSTFVAPPSTAVVASPSTTSTLTTERETIVMLETEHRPAGDEPGSSRHRRSPAQWLLVAVAAATVAVVSTLLVGARGDDDKPVDTATAAPTTAATPAPAQDVPDVPGPSNPQAEPVPDVMTGGRYLFRPLPEVGPLTIAATGPDHWVGYRSWAMDGPDPVRASAPTGIGIAFMYADGVYNDPCHWDLLGNGQEGQPGEVAVGPTVDDLVTALRANTFYTSTAATPVTIDGYAGQELELQLPPGPFTTCDKTPGDADGHAFVFSGKAGLYAQGPANRWHVFILDVEGTRLLAVVLSYEGTPQTDLDRARNVIETLDIEP
jgi:hypothetical protein